MNRLEEDEDIIDEIDDDSDIEEVEPDPDVEEERVQVNEKVCTTCRKSFPPTEIEHSQYLGDTCIHCYFWHNYQKNGFPENFGQTTLEMYCQKFADEHSDTTCQHPDECYLCDYNHKRQQCIKPDYSSDINAILTVGDPKHFNIEI